MTINKVKNFIYENKVLIGSIVLFCTVILVLGLPYLKWGFEVDDCGVLYGSKITSWRDIVGMFLGSDHYTLTWPSNYHVHSQTFFNVYYRPLCRLFFVPQVALFGFQPYGYFLIMIVFHAINSVIFFYIMQRIIQAYWLSLWAALFFAFHMSLGSWMGWIAAQNYPVTLMLLFISLINFFVYLEHKKKIALVYAVASFLCALFMFELVIFFPIIFIAIWLLNSFLKEQLSLQLPSCKNYFFAIVPFLASLLFFLCIRVFAYPARFVGGESKGILIGIKKILIARTSCLYADIASFLADFGNVALIPNGNFLVKMSLALLFFFLLAMLWVKNRYKVAILIIMAVGVSSSWPMFIKQYHGRYVYFLVPCFVMSICFLLRYFPWYELKKHWGLRLLCWSGLISLLLVNSVYTVRSLKNREFDSFKLSSLYKQLASIDSIHGKQLCFVGLPLCLRNSQAQAVWLQGINEDLPIYYDHQNFVDHGLDGDENRLMITPIKNGFNLVVENPRVNSFGTLSDACSMGIVNVLRRNGNNAPTEIDYVFDDKYLQQDLLFVTWDYAKGQFKLLEVKPLS